MRPFWLDEMREARAQGNARVRRVLSPDPDHPGRVIWQGRSLWHFASNDYLGLARDPRMAKAGSRAAFREGSGAGASPLVSGWLPGLRRLERELASFEETESALVFASGYAANLAVVSSLVGLGDLILSDELNHASLIDGCRLSRAKVLVYRHSDIEHARELAQKYRWQHRRMLLVTDSVFSMDGDEAPLVELGELALVMDGLLLVDEAHATGVMGEGGRGLAHQACEKLAELQARMARVGTLSKALGAQGGYLLGSKSLVRWLVNKGRSYLFSTALAPGSVAAGRAGLKLAQDEPWRREKVLQLALQLRQLLREYGFEVLPGTSPIVPVFLGESCRAVMWSKELADQGFLVPAIRPPSVPANRARLRISLTANLDESVVAALALALNSIAGRGL